MRASVGRDQANVVDHLLHDRDVTLALHDLEIAVVTDRQHRRTFVAPDDAALGETAVFGSIELMTFIARGALLLALLRFREQRRDAPFRTRDERSANARGDLRLLLLEAELAHIVMHVVVR